MARRLMHILQSSVDFNANDLIFFNFKKHKFTGIVTSAGLIHNIKWIHADTGDVKLIFETRTFESLTDWTETCIQEQLDEYHTRYSAWRRVRHEKTNFPMETIYKEYQRIKLEEKTDNKLSNHEKDQLLTLRAERILYLEKCLEKRDEALKKWNTWFNESHPNENMPIKPQPKIEKMEQKEKKIVEKIQPIILNSPGGAYITLQRVQETNPEAQKYLQQIGLSGFKKMAKKFEETNKKWYPPSKTQWFDKTIQDINQNPRLIGKFVHDFFTAKK